MATNYGEKDLEAKIDHLQTELSRANKARDDSECAIRVLIKNSAAEQIRLTSLLQAAEDKIRHLERNDKPDPPLELSETARFVPNLVDLDDYEDQKLPDLSTGRLSPISEPDNSPPTPKEESLSLSAYVGRYANRSWQPARASTIHPQVVNQKLEETGIYTWDQLHWRFDRNTMIPGSVDFFTYGVRYKPDPGLVGTRHRVIISNIPCWASLADVTGRVRGEAIVSIELLDTVALIGTKSALVRFYTEQAAVEYDDFLHSNNIILGGNRIVADIIPTDSYPLSRPLSNRINVHKQTRCLQVHNYPRGIKFISLYHDLSWPRESRFDTIEKIDLRNDDVLSISFSSAFFAGLAFGIFSSYRRYRDCHPRFVPDPCAGDLDQLLVEQDKVTEARQSIAKQLLKPDFQELPNIAEINGPVSRQFTEGSRVDIVHLNQQANMELVECLSEDKEIHGELETIGQLLETSLVDM